MKPAEENGSKRPGKMERPHQTDLCQACKLGKPCSDETMKKK